MGFAAPIQACVTLAASPEFLQEDECIVALAEEGGFFAGEHLHAFVLPRVSKCLLQVLLEL